MHELLQSPLAPLIYSLLQVTLLSPHSPLLDSRLIIFPNIITITTAITFIASDTITITITTIDQSQLQPVIFRALSPPVQSPLYHHSLEHHHNHRYHYLFLILLQSQVSEA